MFPSPVTRLPLTPGRGVALGRARGVAELNLIDLRDLRQQDGLDRVGPMEMQTRLRGIDPFSESQHYPLLVGLNLVDRSRGPAPDQDQRDDAARRLRCPSRGIWKTPPRLSPNIFPGIGPRVSVSLSSDIGSPFCRRGRRPRPSPPPRASDQRRRFAPNAVGDRVYSAFNPGQWRGSLRASCRAGADLFRFALQLAAGGRMSRPRGVRTGLA